MASLFWCNDVKFHKVSLCTKFQVILLNSLKDIPDFLKTCKNLVTSVVIICTAQKSKYLKKRREMWKSSKLQFFVILGVRLNNKYLKLNFRFINTLRDPFVLLQMLLTSFLNRWNTSQQSRNEQRLFIEFLILKRCVHCRRFVWVDPFYCPLTLTPASSTVWRHCI